MKISLNIVFDLLKPYQYETYIDAKEDLCFSSCLSISEDIVKPNNSCLYLGRLSTVLLLREKYADVYCLCVRDRIRDDLESAENIQRLIIINENVALSAIMNIVQSRFFEITDWVQQMQDVLLKDESIQKLVDTGASFLDNNIAIVDASFNLIAYSREVPCDDPVCAALAEYGYHPEESIQKFRKNNLFSIWQKEDMILDDSFATEKYQTLNKIFRFRGTYFAHVVMTFNRNEPSPGLIDLFRIFVGILEIYFERMWTATTTGGHLYDPLLIDLIEGNVSNKNVIEEKAKYVNVPAKGPFCLFQIVPNDLANISIGKMLVEFSELFPRFYFISYQQKLVAINKFQARTDLIGQIKMISITLENFLLKYDALCGTSRIFSTLDETGTAFAQSNVPLKYIRRIKGRELLKRTNLIESIDRRILSFEDYYLFCLLGECDGNAELWYSSEYHKMLRKIYENDCRHKINTLLILNTYLNEERSATATGAILNMHRNTILYHINRIETMFEVDLRNKNTRFMMQLSFTLLELYGFQGE